MAQKRSAYDELHDRFNPILTTKAGTRYERLAAMVWKCLHEADCIVHDVKLLGASPEVAHQIDVSISVNGTPRRVLIECKDYDLSGDAVGLDIIRSFRSVLEDTGISEGMVLTCNGYTKDAQAYAKSKHIKLVVLRQVKQEDLAGRITRAVINVEFSINDVQVATLAFDDANNALFEQALTEIGMQKGSVSSLSSRLFMVGSGQELQYNDFISKLAASRDVPADGQDHQVALGLPDWSVRVSSGDLIPVKGIYLTLRNATDKFTIASQRVAELIVQGLASADLFISADQLQGCSIDEEGEVTLI